MSRSYDAAFDWIRDENPAGIKIGIANEVMRLARIDLRD